MIALMEAEKKPQWNLAVYESIAKSIDKLAKQEHRQQKSVVCSAAMLMFLMADDEDRRQYIEAVKLAEVRGYDGTILEAARKAVEDGSLSRPKASREPPGRKRRAG